MDSALVTLIARVVATNRSATITAPAFFVFILFRSPPNFYKTEGVYKTFVISQFETENFIKDDYLR